MTQPPRYRLTDAEKDALLERQALLIEAQAAQIEALMARLAALEAELAKPRKTSRNSHTPPSQDLGGGRSGNAHRRAGDGCGQPHLRRWSALYGVRSG